MESSTGMAEKIEGLGEDLPQWFIQAMAEPCEDLSLELQGSQIRYFRWGDPSKPAIIFLHGFLAHRHCWAFIAPLLADKYNLIAVDFLGMGDSGSSKDYSLATRLEEIKGLIAALRLSSKPFLVAHSYGGGIALQATKANPDLIRGLLVCDTLMIPPEHVEEFLKHNRTASNQNPTGKKRIYPDWPTIHDRFRLSPEQPCVHSFLFEYMAKHSVKQIAEGWTWKFDPRILLRDDSNRDWWADNANFFASLTIPKGIIYGEKSLLFGGAIKRYLQKESQKPFPMIEIPAAHHHVMLDQPLALAAAIDAVIATWLTQE